MGMPLALEVPFNYSNKLQFLIFVLLVTVTL